MSRTVWDCLQILDDPEKTDSNYGILILNQPIQCEPQLVNSLWSKAIARALVDGGSNRWLDFIEKQGREDFKLPDFISGDFDSIKPRTMDYFKGKGVKIVSTPDQDETDFTKALRCFVEMLERRNLKVKWLLVVCENSGRFDQIIANVNTILRSKHIVQDVPVILLSSGSVTWVLPAGEHTVCVSEEFVERQYCCGLIPLCGATTISTSGLKWNLDNAVSEMGKLVSTSNTYSASKINITCDRALVWTTEYSINNQ